MKLKYSSSLLTVQENQLRPEGKRTSGNHIAGRVHIEGAVLSFKLTYAQELVRNTIAPGPYNVRITAAMILPPEIIF